MKLALKRFVLFVALASSLAAQSKTAAKTEKPVHARSYARKNGKKVKARNRSVRGTKMRKAKKRK